MAFSGKLKLRRAEALRLTGRLFKLRRDVNLVSNVLDTPELFWSEASLKGLYDACREYFEIDQRVQVLNERLSVASDLVRRALKDKSHSERCCGFLAGSHTRPSQHGSHGQDYMDCDMVRANKSQHMLNQRIS